MDKPRLFVGSSTEGKSLAKALFRSLYESAVPTLWTNSVFLPSRFPIEDLELQLRSSHFGVFVATPDDELTKRGESSLTMRDNVLLEFGLFVGILGRRRVFLVVPDSPPINVPSDLLGISMARYDARRAASDDETELAAAVEIASTDIQAALKREWAILKSSEEAYRNGIRNSERGKAIRRLYGVAIRLRDAVLLIQRESIASIFDEKAFESVKTATIATVRETAESFRADSQLAGAEAQLDRLSNATVEALQQFPNPKAALNLEAGKATAISLGLEMAQLYLKGDSGESARSAASSKAKAQAVEVLDVYSAWWNKHRPALENATDQMRDVLFELSTNLVIESQQSLQTRLTPPAPIR